MSAFLLPLIKVQGARTHTTDREQDFLPYTRVVPIPAGISFF